MNFEVFLNICLLELFCYIIELNEVFCSGISLLLVTWEVPKPAGLSPEDIILLLMLLELVSSILLVVGLLSSTGLTFTLLVLSAVILAALLVLDIDGGLLGAVCVF